MSKDPKRLEHPRSVYLIGLLVVAVTLFVLGGVVNHLAFSHHGPGLLLPLVEKIQQEESPIIKEFSEHRKMQAYRRFHHMIDYPEIPEDRQPTCFICHSMLPHDKNRKTRSMLNMHTHYFACETCHLSISEDEAVVYKWYSPLDPDPEGPFFGTSYDPKTGELKYTGDHTSKIAPFYRKNGTLKSTLHMAKSDLAKEYVKVRDALTPEQREGVTKKFHEDIRSTGPECQTCHSSDSILDFEKLGFSKNRIIDLVNLSIKGMLTKYDEFYLPELFEEETADNAEGRDIK